LPAWLGAEKSVRLLRNCTYSEPASVLINLTPMEFYISAKSTIRTPGIYFFHIPKTAGMSVWHFLDQVFPSEKICPWWLWDQLVTATTAELEGWDVFRGHFLAHLNQNNQDWYNQPQRTRRYAKIKPVRIVLCDPLRPLRLCSLYQCCVV